MAKTKITKRAVDSATSGPSPSFLWDDDVKGFGLKVKTSGAKSYVFQFRMGGRGSRTQRVTIGDHGPWTPDRARDEAKRIARLVDEGRDPVAEAAEKKRETVDLAFPVYAEKFIADYLSNRWAGSFDMAAGLLRRRAIPAFKRKTIKSITRSDVATLLDTLASQPGSRRNLFAVLRRLFRWAVNRGDLDRSPLSEMDAPAAPSSRDRVLSDVELAHIWASAEALSYPYCEFIKALVLTGQRREEVAALSWVELDRENKNWTLPASRAKNGQTHEIPLSSMMLLLLDDVAQRTGKRKNDKWPASGYVFEVARGKRLTAYSHVKKLIDALVALRLRDTNPEILSDMPDWRFHDLRRTFATAMQRLGVRFEVTEALLNHRSGSRSGVAGVYQRYDWSLEKRESMDAWARKLCRIIGECAAPEASLHGNASEAM